MSDQSKLGLGHIIITEQHRDAIHIAVAPVTTGERLFPGAHVGFLQDGTVAEMGAQSIGVVDPFLREPRIAKGERVWLYLYPGTITSLRHEWTHPAFEQPESSPATPLDPENEAKRYLENVAMRCGVSYDRMMEAVAENDYIHMGENETYKDVLEGPEYEKFCASVDKVLGRHIESPYPFSCSC